MMNTFAAFLICAFLQSSLSHLVDEFAELDKTITKLFDEFDLGPRVHKQQTTYQTMKPEQKTQQSQTTQAEQKLQENQQHQQQQQQHQQQQQTQKRPPTVFSEIEKAINKYTNELNNVVIKIEEDLGQNVLKDAEKLFELGRPHFLDIEVDNESFINKLGLNYKEFMELKKLYSDVISIWDHFVTTVVKKSDRTI